MPSMNDAQFLFSECLAQLLAEIKRRGEKATIGDVWAVDLNPILKWLVSNGLSSETIEMYKKLNSRKHSPTSKHYDKLAVDINLFKSSEIIDGYAHETRWHYCTTTEDHAELGQFWKSLHPACEWGGDFPGKKKDGNHYQINKDKV
jgi:hypothetical protein